MVTTALFQEELQPGLELPDFVLYERIGFGGEGLIFSAWDKKNEKLVAIKFFPKRDEDGAEDKNRLVHDNESLWPRE